MVEVSERTVSPLLSLMIVCFCFVLCSFCSTGASSTQWAADTEMMGNQRVGDWSSPIVKCKERRGRLC